MGGFYAVEFFSHLLKNKYIHYMGTTDFNNSRRRLPLIVSNQGIEYFKNWGNIISAHGSAFACLDNTEKKPHLAGIAGELVLSYLLNNNLISRDHRSRILVPDQKAVATLRGGTNFDNK